MKFNDQKYALDFYNKKISKNYVKDDLYNNCGKCQKNLNKHFCVNCSKNLCDKCKDNCEKNKHDLKKLDEMKESTDKLIKEIEQIITEFNLNQKELEENIQNENKSKEKEQKNYDIKFNETEIKKEFPKAVNINEDISLTYSIISKKYNNHFHFKNIEGIYYYFQNRYKNIYNKKCIILTFDISEIKEKKEIELFEKDFVKENEDRLSLIINNKFEQLVNKIEIKKEYLNEDYLEILIVENEQKKPIKNMIIMFYNLFKPFYMGLFDFKYVINRNELNISLLDINNFFYDNYEENGKNIFYQGKTENGKKVGEGKLLYHGIVYEGEWVNDKAEGKGKIIFKEGDYYEGQWKNNAANGRGKLYYNRKIIYEGDWVDGRMEGEGIFYHKDTFYIGYFKNCFANGKGIHFYSSGDIMYYGDWVNTLMHGEGIYYYTNGEFYTGQWEYTKRHGKGTLYYSNGKIQYEGDWINDQMEGFGKYYFEDKEWYYEGQWERGQKNGEGKLYYNGEVIYEGVWVNDEMQ